MNYMLVQKKGDNTFGTQDMTVNLEAENLDSNFR